MATTAEELVVNIKAKLDQAKRDTAAYQKQLDQLEEGATVAVKVKGGRDLDEVFAKVERLGTEDATIVLGIEMAKAQRDLKDLLYDISRLDAEDATIEVKAEQVAQVRGDLEQLEAKVKELNDVPLEPGRGGNPRAGFDKIVDGADQANSATANMVGNASQDMGELAGVTGSAGVAVGQLAEYFTDSAFAAKEAGQGMGLMVKSFASAAVPIAGIAVATGLLSAAFKKGTDAAEAQAEGIERVAKAAEEGTGVIGALRDQIEETGKLRFQLGGGFDQSGLVVEDLRKNLANLNLELPDFIAFTKLSDEAAGAYADAQVKRGDSEKDWISLLVARLALNKQVAAADFERALNEQIGAEDSTEAAEKLIEGLDKVGEAYQQQADDAREAAEALAQWAVDVQHAQGALNELASTFNIMATRQDALTRLFALGNAPEEAAASVRDITLAIDELSTKAEGVDVNLGLSADNVNADELLDAIDALRPQIQAKVTEAFSAGGPQAATDMANAYVEQVFNELGGKVSREDIARLLGLDNIEATVAVAMEMSSVEQAKRQLELLTGLTGETPYTASIALALDAGTITGAQAQALIQAQLGGAGVEVPAELAVPTTEAALAEADAALKAGKPVTMPTALDTTAAQAGAEAFAEEVEDTTVTAPLDADARDAERERDAFVRDTEAEVPVMDVASETREAMTAILALRLFAALLGPKVTVTANTMPAMLALLGVAAQRPRVPVDAYLDDYPTAREIADRIGPVRVPVDTYLRNEVRITGAR